MSFIEAVRGVTVKLATGLRNLKRGYSDEVLVEARRILNGEITPADRLKFRSEETDRLFSLLNGASRSPLIGGPPLDAQFNPFFLGLEIDLERRVQELYVLPDNQIDQTLTERARARLQSWHQLQGSLSIVNPSPPFIRRG